MLTLHAHNRLHLQHLVPRQHGDAGALAARWLEAQLAAGTLPSTTMGSVLLSVSYECLSHMKC